MPEPLRLRPERMADLRGAGMIAHDTAGRNSFLCGIVRLYSPTTEPNG